MRPVLFLGAKLVDGKPGPTLARRLETGLPYALNSSHVVVSGYHGEAEAMAQWLVERGVPADAITLETAASSTNENLEKAFNFLKGYPEWTVVTSDFHSLRVKMWAWHHRIRVQLVTAPTPVSSAPKMWLREFAALPHSFSRIVWRKLRR